MTQYCHECGVEYGLPDRPAYHDDIECAYMKKLTPEQKKLLWEVHRIGFHEPEIKRETK